MFPRAIRADSASTFRGSFSGFFVKWFTAGATLSGERHSYSAPRWLSESRMSTASWISLPSKTPQPLRITPTFAIAPSVGPAVPADSRVRTSGTDATLSAGAPDRHGAVPTTFLGLRGWSGLEAVGHGPNERLLSSC